MFSADTRESIAKMVENVYYDGVQSRNVQNTNHKEYDLMFRGRAATPRKGPWKDSANLHVQMPYWLVDSIHVRLMISIWNQTPLVVPFWEEDDDQKKARRAAHLIEWNLQPKRMHARPKWARSSKIRLIHGCSVAIMSYHTDYFSYREQSGETQDVPQTDPKTNLPIMGSDGPVMRKVKADPIRRKKIKYQGPVLHPLEFDDTVVPMECMNLQPLTLSNPGGAGNVIVRQHERLSMMTKKVRSGAYAFMFDDEEAVEQTDDGEGSGARDREWWINHAPDQTRSGSGHGSENTSRERQQERLEGRNRSISARRRPTERPNPDFEILTYFGPYEDPDTDQEEEMVFFVCLDPLVFLGGFYLSDYYWQSERPLLEWHYQTVSNRFYSMGVCEIAAPLSAELDTIHNLRLDIGFATNLPFYFYRSTTGFNPNEVELRPFKGIPVEDPRDFVFPQVQNVTSFYEREETLLLTLVERVMGVTDLFLGVSPTTGASARHATGFVGTQQEAEARMSEIISQDADTFAAMCRMIYNLEMQYGPEERAFRLEGEESPIIYKGMTRDDFWLEGVYDFRVGANAGSFSHTIKQQQAKAALEVARSSPITNQNPGFIWEAEKMFYDSISVDYKRLIGEKEVIAGRDPVKPDEENWQMSQYILGDGVPVPVHPQDDDNDHTQKHMAFTQSPFYQQAGRPNQQGIFNHIQQHNAQMQQKQQQIQAQAMQNMQQGGGRAMGQGQGADPMNRAMAQVAGVNPSSSVQQAYVAQQGPPQNGAAGGGNR